MWEENNMYKTWIKQEINKKIPLHLIKLLDNNNYKQIVASHV